MSQAIQTGEYAQTGTAIVRLVDTINLEVSAQVPASLVQPIKKGTLIEVSGMGRSVMAPVRALVPVGDSINRTMELRISLKDTGFLVGTPVRVTLATAQPKEVVAVPRDALILRSNSQYIFVVDEDNVAHKQDVLLGYAEGEMIEVIGDVSSNATVIIRGGERLRDGQSVSWGEAEPKQPLKLGSRVGMSHEASASSDTYFSNWLMKILILSQASIRAVSPLVKESRTNPSSAGLKAAPSNTDTLYCS